MGLARASRLGNRDCWNLARFKMDWVVGKSEYQPARAGVAAKPDIKLIRPTGVLAVPRMS